MKSGIQTVCFLLLIVPAQVVFAHHGTANQFDQTKTMQVSGTVVKINFVNPHSYVYFTAPDEQGNVQDWRCEMRAATLLRRSGWTQEMFSPGTKIKIVGVPAFREPYGCYVNTIEFDDGKVVERYDQLAENDKASVAQSRSARLASGEPNISGDWAAMQRRPTEEQVRAIATGMGMGPTMPGRPARYVASEAGEATTDGYDREDNPRFACESTNIIFDWTFDQHINRIVQHNDRIVFTYGLMDMVRTIHMDGAERPANYQPSRTGYSIGRWEDDTLVVETNGFSVGMINSRNGLMHSDQLQVTERFSIDPKDGSLVRDYSGNDPLNLAEAFDGQDIIFPSEIPREPYNCTDLTEELVEGF